MWIGFSIGCCWKFIPKSENRNDFISFWRVFQEREYFNAIEICMTPEDEKHFKLSTENYEWLESLKHVSYHLTQWNEDTKRVIDQLPYINYFACHEDNSNILTEKFLNKYPHKLLIENTEDRVTMPYNQMCLDYAHIQSTNFQSIDYFLEFCKTEIKEIHCSCYDPEKKHVPFFLHPEKFPDIDISEYPVIIEANFENAEEAVKELNFLKGRIYDK